ncbi:MAG: esterase family protein [Bacteroidales bacterium]|nr:esterase family protein [Bacteroidales bacterium]
MKKLLLLLLLPFAALCAWGEPLAKSVIKTDSVQSKILGESINYNVYLPAGYDASAAEKYPVVYLLHGLFGTHVDWATTGHMKEVVDELIASGECRKLIIIMPDAGDPDIHNNWNGYLNMPGCNYEDFFFLEFMPQVESRYSIIPDKQHRAIMGLSMGGGGSTIYSQRHPDKFSSCYSMSGWLDEKDPGKEDPSDKFYYARKSVHELSAIEFVRNSDEAALEKLRSVKWFFDCGDDDYLLELSVQMHVLMRDRKVKSELRVRDGWHSWEYWHTALRLSLPFASRNFEQ